MSDVITLGAATRDVFLISREFQLIRSHEFSTGVGECVALGAKIDIDDLFLSTGGGATNAAVTFAHLGYSTAAIAKIGKDEAGQTVINDLQAAAVDTSLLRVSPKEKTAYSTLLTAKNGERSVLVYRGASQNLSAADVPLTKLKTRCLYVTSLGGNVQLLDRVVTAARKAGAMVVVNPGKAELKQAKELLAVLPKIDVLLVNLEEARMLVEQVEGDAQTIGQALAPLVGTLIVTNGSKGSYAFSQGNGWYARTSGIKSISRTGAGDAFGSGFVAALLKGLPLEDALRVGTLNAESVIQHFGAKAGILKTWPKGKTLQKVSVKKLR